jgi:hypothetical protein
LPENCPLVDERRSGFLLFILDEKDLHLMGHFAIHPLKVSSDLVCGLLRVALLVYTRRKTCVRLHPTVIFVTRLDLITS